MRFAHMADIHIGGWRDPKLKDISFDAFAKAVDISLQREVDFILLAGDIFNTSLPSIDALKDTVKKLNEIKKAGVSVYIVPGSHDYSPSGKTMLDVIEETGLWTNVVKGEVVDEKLRLKFTVDQKTGVKITGLLGKRAALEKGLYESLDKEYLENEPGPKIFLFHSAITELKPTQFQHVESLPLSFFPRGFDYYAGGHVHVVDVKEMDGYKKIVYPGPLFPNNFAEIEELGKGGFFIYDDGKVERVDIELYPVVKMIIDCTNLTPEQTSEKLTKEIETREVEGAIVTLRLKGKLASGKIAEIDLRGIMGRLYDQGAYFVMKNLSKLESPVFEEIRIEQGTIDEVEDKLIREHAGQQPLEGYSADEQRALIRNLISAFDAEKKEGETVPVFEERMMKDVRTVLSKG